MRVILSNQDIIHVWAPNSTFKHRKDAWNILEKCLNEEGHFNNFQDLAADIIDMLL